MPPDRVEGLGFWGFRVSGFRVYSLGFWGFRVSGFRALGV